MSQQALYRKIITMMGNEYRLKNIKLLTKMYLLILCYYVIFFYPWN